MNFDLSTIFLLDMKFLLNSLAAFGFLFNFSFKNLLYRLARYSSISSISSLDTVSLIILPLLLLDPEFPSLAFFTDNSVSSVHFLHTNLIYCNKSHIWVFLLFFSDLFQFPHLAPFQAHRSLGFYTVSLKYIPWMSLRETVMGFYFLGSDLRNFKLSV